MRVKIDTYRTLGPLVTIGDLDHVDGSAEVTKEEALNIVQALFQIEEARDLLQQIKGAKEDA